MDWKDLAGTLIKAGAPLIGNAIAGPLGGTIGNVLGGLIASQLGVEATPEAVQGAIDTRPAAEITDKLRAADAEAANKWTFLTESAKAQAEVAKVQTEAVNETIRVEAQAAVAAGDGWLGKWRGIHAWELTLECPFWAGMIIYSVLWGGGTAINELTSATAVIMSYWGARFGVLGVHVWQGSNERQAAIHGGAAVPNDKTEAIVAAVLKKIGKR